MDEKITRKDFLKISALATAGILTSGSLPAKKSTAELETKVKRLWEKPDVEGVIRPNNLPVFLFPLRWDYFYNDDKEEPVPIKKLLLGPENQVGFKGYYSFDVNGSQINTTFLHNTTGNEAVLPVAVLSEMQNFNFLDMRTNYFSPKNKIIGEYTHTSITYPNKIKNILMESIALSEFQEKYGSFIGGKEYSFLRIIGEKGWGNFFTGLNSYGYEVNAGGICAGATNLAKACLEAGATIKAKGHPNPYWIGPIRSSKNVIRHWRSDAAISSAAKEEDAFDLKWTLPETANLEIYVSVIPNGKPRAKNIDEEHNADARLVVNYAWTPDEPENNTEKLYELLRAYDNYRETGIKEKILTQSKVLENIMPDPESKADKMFYFMYREEKLPNFQEELKTNEYLKEILMLQELINTYGDETTSQQFKKRQVPGIGTLIKQTDWYKTLESGRKEYLEKGLNFTDFFTYTYEEEALQCVTWTVLLHYLGYEESPASVERFSGGAGDYPPGRLKNRSTNEMETGGINFIRPFKVDDCKTGDLFFDYEPGKHHMGAIIEKKEVDGITKLLLTDSNRKADGKIKLFEVDYANYPVILGGWYHVLGRRTD